MTPISISDSERSDDAVENLLREVITHAYTVEIVTESQPRLSISDSGFNKRFRQSWLMPSSIWQQR